MKIIHVPRRFVRSHWGGTETVILETCKRIQRMNHETLILCPNALASENHEFIEGIQVKRVPYFYPYFGLNTEARALLDRKGGNIFSIALMRALEKEPQLDVIHLHTAKRVGGIGRYVARKRGIPYVVSLHGGVFDVPEQEAATWTEPTRGAFEWGKLLGWWVGSRRVLDDAAAIICVGQEEKNRTQSKYPNKRVIHIPNGVDANRFLSGDGKAFRNSYGIPDDAFVILTVGRIDPQKNQLFVVERIPELLKIHSKAHQVIIGPVTHEQYDRDILRAIAHNGVGNRITVIPGLESNSQALVDAYHAANLFLLPSIHEPFGIVVLEAWAAGLPVIASRVGGIPSFVVDHIDGLLFDANSSESLLHAFRFAVDHPEDMQKMAQTGLQKARTVYSWEVITNHLVSLYEEAIRENPFRK